MMNDENTTRIRLFSQRNHDNRGSHSFEMIVAKRLDCIDEQLVMVTEYIAFHDSFKRISRERMNEIILLGNDSGQFRKIWKGRIMKDEWRMKEQ